MTAVRRTAQFGLLGVGAGLLGLLAVGYPAGALGAVLSPSAVAFGSLGTLLVGYLTVRRPRAPAVGSHTAVLGLLVTLLGGALAAFHAPGAFAAAVWFLAGAFVGFGALVRRRAGRVAEPAGHEH